MTESKQHNPAEYKRAEEHLHIVSYSKYIFIWLALLTFTAVTVTISGINFGGLTLGIAILIAIIKSTLVINIFMHIKFDDVVFKVFIAVGILTLLSAFVFTFVDYLFR